MMHKLVFLCVIIDFLSWEEYLVSKSKENKLGSRKWKRKAASVNTNGYPPKRGGKHLEQIA